MKHFVVCSFALFSLIGCSGSSSDKSGADAAPTQNDGSVVLGSDGGSTSDADTNNGDGSTAIADDGSISAADGSVTTDDGGTLGAVRNGCAAPTLPSVDGAHVISLSRDDTGKLVGTYELFEGGPQVAFSAKSTGERSATASFELSFSAATINVTVTDGSHASLTINDVALDGRGEPSSTEMDAINALNNLADMVALFEIIAELGCVCSVTPSEAAALLFPAQALIKYSGIYDPTLFTASFENERCAYLRTVNDERPSPTGVVQLERGNPFVTVFGFFPFDEAGSRIPETSGTLDSATGACDSTCRGACGPDCPEANCPKMPDLVKMCVLVDGRRNGQSVRDMVYDCGVHPSCIAHDECYDRCNTEFGCAFFGLGRFLCMHDVSDPDSCDSIAIAGSSWTQAFDWASGGGPFTERREFRYKGEPVSDDDCPSEIGECLAAGTLVHLSDGRQIPIETVRIGDSIVSIDPASQLTTIGNVDNTIVHRGDWYTLDRLVLAYGTELEVTPNHPIWTMERGFVETSDLHIGETLLEIDEDGVTVHQVTLVEVIRAATVTDVVYNLKTSRDSYIAANLLVHNKCLAEGSLIDTPNGALAIETLRAGDVVYGEENGVRVIATVTRRYEKDTALDSLPGRRVTSNVIVTDNHLIETNAGPLAAGTLALPALSVRGTVYDLSTSTGNYYADGVLLRAASE